MQIPDQGISPAAGHYYRALITDIELQVSTCLQHVDYLSHAVFCFLFLLSCFYVFCFHSVFWPFTKFQLQYLVIFLPRSDTIYKCTHECLKLVHGEANQLQRCSVWSGKLSLLLLDSAIIFHVPLKQITYDLESFILCGRRRVYLPSCYQQKIISQEI